MRNQLYVMMIKNLANHIKSEENRREMEAGRPHMTIFKASEVISAATGKLLGDVTEELIKADELVIPKEPTTPNVDSIANIARDAFQLGKRVAHNPDYYSLSDPLGDFLNKEVYEPYGGK